MSKSRRPSLDSSVSRESFAARIGGKVREALTPNILDHPHTDSPNDDNSRGRSLFSSSSQRSQSRGRDPIVSTGRGGAGNLRASSRTRSAYDNDDDERRGRSSVANADLHKAVHAGRGGVGNVRSPSRDPGEIRSQQAERNLEDKLLREAHEKNEREGYVPTGRGGAGNIKSHNQSPSQSRSRSRSRTRDFLHRATSRERSSSRDLSTQHHHNYGEEEGNTSLAAVDEETTKASN